MKIIIRMPNWLGDAVMATPLILDLKRHYPNATLTAMILKPLAPLLEGNPNVDEIFSFEKPNCFFRREKRRHLIERLRQGHYDLGILTTNSFSSALWFWEGKVKRRVGFRKDGRSLFLTDSTPPPKHKEHLVTTYKRILTPLNIALSDTKPELFITEEEKKRASLLLQEYHIAQDRPLLGINPLAAFGPAKCWPKEKYRALAKRLISSRPDLTVLFFGDQKGIHIVKEICHELPPDRVINLAGLTTLRELMALLSTLDLFITNDSGPMHIAAALKVPLIALFGSTCDITTGPYKHGEVIHKHVECSPCFKKTCPIDFRCMQRIEVEEVAALALQRLPQ